MSNSSFMKFMKSVTISMYGKGLKHPESSSIVREGYKKFTIDTEIVDLLGIINSPDSPDSPDSIESKKKAIEIINQLILDSVKQLSSKLERDLSVSNYDDNKPLLFNPLKEEESSKFFDELIRGITIDDLHNEIVLSQLMSSSSSSSFNSKIWNAFVVEVLMPSINGFRVLVMNQPMMNQDKLKSNIIRLKQGQKMNEKDKGLIIERITQMIESINSDEFGVIKEGSLIDLRIKQLSKDNSNSENLSNFKNTIEDIKNRLIEFAGSDLTIKALEWVSKSPKEIVDLDL